MSSPPPRTNASPVDLSSLSISAQLQQQQQQQQGGYEQQNPPSNSNYFATAPASNPYGAGASSFGDGPYMNTTMGLSSKPARGGLPSHWLDQTQAASDSRSMSPPSTDLHSISSSGSPPPQFQNNGYQQQPPPGMMMGAAPGQQQQQLQGGGLSGAEDDVIPTAIVIKNIPFSVKREMLLDIIASLQIPTPYAFNYHLDAAGAFRGLAFANFRLPGDADAVVAALNGFDVQGRKLRVEYKKVLQAGEKERIEREKAIRRMRSMQLEKEKERGGVAAPPPGMGNNQGGGDWEDYGVVQQHQHYGGSPMMAPQMMGLGMGHPSSAMEGSPIRNFSAGSQLSTPHQHQSMSPLPQVPPVPQIPQQYYASPQRQQSLTPQVHLTGPQNHSPPGGGLEDPFIQPQFRSFSPPSHTSGSPPLQAPSKPATELDLNDPSTLEIYSRILVFKEDRMRDELAFSRSLSPKQRRVVHLVAQKLGVYHYSVGVGEDRYAVVTRIERDQPATPARLSRAQSSYLAPTQGSNASPGSSNHLTAPSAALRAKKSMPDLASLHAPSPRLNSRASNGNIREGYHTISSHGRRSTPSFNGLFAAGANGSNNNGGGSSVPPVPTLPPMPSGLVDPSTAGVVRQPRGPGVGGFGRRPSGYSGTGAGGASATLGNNNALGGLDTRSHEPLEI